LYPPKTNQDLRKLFETVVNATPADHQKQALVYYILKDCKPIADYAENFARRVWLPRKYKLLISGLHLLDHSQPKQALELLTDPSLTPTFPDEILYTLLQNPKLDNSLAIAYYFTVSPPLEDAKTLDAYFSLLCKTSIVQAYHFSQMRAKPERKRLFEQLVLAALSPAGDNRASRALNLISLPFVDEEAAWFEDFLLEGNGASLLGAKDSVVMRRIAIGKDYTDIQALHRFRGQKIDGVNWGDITANLQPTSAT
jgi:Nuclear pore complex assembly